MKSHSFYDDDQAALGEELVVFGSQPCPHPFTASYHLITPLIFSDKDDEKEGL